MKLSRDQKIQFQQKIINWYKSYGRDFPWRKTSDPYKILIAEFLLQKTHVRKVEDVYTCLLSKYPSIEHLAISDVVEVLDIIKSLGFYNRAERLTKIAKEISGTYSGHIPNEYETLLGFRGIGKYIATAVMVFAFEDKRVIVDTNVIKVFKYELGYSSEKKRPRTDDNLWVFTQTLAPEKEIREFNWGLLDYGAQLF